MFKKLIIKGFLLGIMAGFLVTLFDSLYMLIPHLYTPYSYPLLLVIFNSFFWMSVGGLSGLSLWIFVRKKENLQRKENFYWALFFLLPFTIIYGFLGRLCIPVSIWAVTYGKPAFDHHLSFVWVALILLFLVLYLKEKGNDKDFPSIFLALEILTFILFFQFCSNLLYTRIPRYYSEYQNLFRTIKLERDQFFIMVYVVGVLSILSFYFITCFKIRPLIKGGSARNNICTIVVLFSIVSGCLAGFFALSHKRQIKSGIPPVVTTKNQAEVKVPHVILIVLDTVRADHLSIYGHPGVTKNLQEFSRDALVFENFVATSSWTIPSHASLFTGLYPSEHGSYGNLDPKRKDPWGFPLPFPLSDEFMTLAEIFRENGYKTSAIVSNSLVLEPMFKLDQGFQSIDCSRSIGAIYQQYPFRPILHTFCCITNIYPKYTLYYRTAEDITKESIRLLKNSLPSPIFLFINYLDAHGPYLPPRPFAGYYLNKSFPHFYRLKLYILGLIGRLDKESRDLFQLSQYDGEIAYLDNQLGKLFSQSKKMEMYESSLIIITSDHGELFGEHGIYWHKSLMYEGVVKIPLIIKFPFSKRMGRYKEIATLSDLYPTILSICGLPIPDGISGKSFGNSSSPIVSEFYNYGIGKHQILYDGQYKYMKCEYQREAELYNLDEDPKEKENLAERLPSIVAIMERKLKDWENTHTPKGASSLDEEATMTQSMREQLKALGYIQ